MKCNLVKTITTKKGSKGQDIKFTNYYLQFENGKSVSIMARYIPTNNITDEEKIADIEKSNSRNAQRLDDFADVIVTKHE